jgi:SAM-dependent methyltransferase
VRGLRLGGRWLVLGAGAIAPLAVSREPAFDGAGGGRAVRAGRWRAWFESWRERPLAQRSSGFGVLPGEYFAAAAGFVAAALDLDPEADSVLDVGCDSAMLSRRVAPRCRALTGADLVPALLWSAPLSTVRAAGGGRPAFLAADARRLPFRDGAFDKAYCVSTIHTLPSREDGVRVVRELVRVCAPGGRVLVGSVPDRARRWRARRECWRRGGWRERLGLAASLLLPAAVKDGLRALARRPPEDRLISLEYDLGALRRRLGDLDLECRVVPFPEDFWSRDFRATRSNLLISVPERAESGRPAHAVAAGAVAAHA